MAEKIERVKTYIKGFDEQISGGVPRGHVVLVCGTPGTMKSSVTANMLYNNALREGKKALYITLEEGSESLLGQMRDFGFSEIDDIEFYVVDIGKIRLSHKEDEGKKNWLEVLTKYIKQRVEINDFDIIAIDSLAALYSLTEMQSPRQEMFHFMRNLKTMNATVLMISEATIGGEGKITAYDEDFLADGILYLKLHEIGETDVQLRIRCVKMRRTKHYPGWLRLIFKDGQFTSTQVISE